MKRFLSLLYAFFLILLFNFHAFSMMQSHDHTNTNEPYRSKAFVKIEYNSNPDSQHAWQSRTTVRFFRAKESRSTLQEFINQGFKLNRITNFLSNNVQYFNEKNTITLENLDATGLDEVRNILSTIKPVAIAYGQNSQVPEEDRAQVKAFLDNLMNTYLDQLEDPAPLQEKQRFSYTQVGSNKNRYP